MPSPVCAARCAVHLPGGDAREGGTTRRVCNPLSTVGARHGHADVLHLRLSLRRVPGERDTGAAGSLAQGQPGPVSACGAGDGGGGVVLLFLH